MTDPLTVLRKNRRGLRKRGATSQCLEVVECYTNCLRKHGRDASLAMVGRLMGISRQLVHRHMRRAEEILLVVRIGRVFMLNARSLLRWASEFVAERAAHVRELGRKRLARLDKSRCVNTRLTHTPEIKFYPEKEAEERYRAQAELAQQLNPADVEGYWLKAMAAEG